MAPLSLKMRRAIIKAAIADAEAGKPNPFKDFKTKAEREAETASPSQRPAIEPGKSRMTIDDVALSIYGHLIASDRAEEHREPAPADLIAKDAFRYAEAFMVARHNFVRDATKLPPET